MVTHPVARLLTRSALLAASCTAGSSTHAAEAQPYPSRPIRLIVAVAPGGGTDIISRLVATRPTESLGQTVVVDNRGGGNLHYRYQPRGQSTSDGYTLLTATNAWHAINPGLFRDLPYDPLK